MIVYVKYEYLRLRQLSPQCLSWCVSPFMLMFRPLNCIPPNLKSLSIELNWDFPPLYIFWRFCLFIVSSSSKPRPSQFVLSLVRDSMRVVVNAVVYAWYAPTLVGIHAWYLCSSTLIFEIIREFISVNTSLN